MCGLRRAEGVTFESLGLQPEQRREFVRKLKGFGHPLIIVDERSVRLQFPEGALLSNALIVEIWAKLEEVRN